MDFKGRDWIFILYALILNSDYQGIRKWKKADFQASSFWSNALERLA
jgi:hypothetical protein